MPEIGAIDIGSNAMRMALGEIRGRGKVKVTDNFREAVRLGADVFSQGKVSDGTLEDALEALANFKREANKREVRRIRAVATSALREASNSRELIERSSAALGIAIEVISAKEEAELILTAVESEVDISSGLSVLLDIGGGSIEVTVVKNSQVLAFNTYPLGTVRLLQLVKRAAQNGSETIRQVLAKQCHELRDDLKQELAGAKADFCVGTGGNLESLERIKRKFFKRKGSDFVSKAELGEILAELETRTYKERIEQMDMKPDRADVIEPACLIIQEILNDTSADGITIPGVGLKEGVLIQMAEQGA